MSLERPVYLEAHILQVKTKDAELVEQKRRKGELDPEHKKFKDVGINNQLEIYDSGLSTNTFFKVIQRFAKSFDNKYDGPQNGSTNKGIILIENSLKIDEDAEIISGQFKGGEFGNGKDLYDAGDASKLVENLGSDKITTYTYYFMLWVPQEYKKGILVIQNFGRSTSCNSVFRNKLQVFMNKEIPEIVEINKLASEDTLRLMLNDGMIKEYTLKKHSVNSDFTRDNLSKIVGKSFPVTLSYTMEDINKKVPRKLIDIIVKATKSKTVDNSFFTLPDTMTNDNLDDSIEANLLVQHGKLKRKVQLFKGVAPSVADVMPEEKKKYDIKGFPTFTSINSYVTKELLDEYKDLLGLSKVKP